MQNVVVRVVRQKLRKNEYFKWIVAILCPPNVTLWGQKITFDK
jgi:hypothetical protein